MGKINWKFWITVVLLFLAGYFLYTKDIKLGLDLQGGTRLRYEATPIGDNVLTTEDMNTAIMLIKNRVDRIGVNEPNVTRHGDNSIVVQLPGVKDPKEAKALIGTTAILEFRIVDNTENSGKALMLLRDKNITPAQFREKSSKYPDILKLLPQGFSIFEDREGNSAVVLGPALLTGDLLSKAEVKLGQYNQPHVSLEFKSEGAKIFADITGTYKGRQLAIVLDGIVQSAPNINARIPDGKAVIEGNFTVADAQFLVNVLKGGNLPVKLTLVEERTVGASLGDDAIRKGFTSALIGLVAVLLFMLIYYRTSGLIANVALVINLVFLLAAMAFFQSTLTLPGVAGIALTLAMAVDANVLILERIREELAMGKTPRVAVDAGYNKVFATILDTHITSLIAAAFLFQFGTGPIQGFAVTLSIGLIISLFTSIVVTKLIYDFLFRENFLSKLKI